MKDKKVKKLKREIEDLRITNELWHMRYNALMRSYLRLTTELEELRNEKEDLNNG